MLSGATFRASEMAGTAVFRIVVSNDSIKNATATSHGNSVLLDAEGEPVVEGALLEDGEDIEFRVVRRRGLGLRFTAVSMMSREGRDVHKNAALPR